MPSLALLSAALMGAYLAGFFAFTAKAGRAAGRPVWLFGRGGRQGLPAFLFRLAFAGGLVLPLLRLAGALPVTAFATLPVALRLAGLGLALAGALFALEAQRVMGASWRIGAAAGHSGAIVETGPFRLSRNPVFVGQVVLFAGFALVWPDLPQLALLAAVVLAVRLQAATEEAVLARDLGAPYRAYCRRVRRWL